MIRTVDLRSDTVTRPSPAMRQAMAEAVVGDDVMGEDPTVNRLEALAAERLGKERALLLPSGTMANLTAFLTLSTPGDTVLLSEQSHPVHYEAGNIARFGGLLARTLPGACGKVSVEQLERIFVQRDDPHLSPMTIVAIENTTNRGSGACYTPREVDELGAFCKEREIKLHCDGARLFNAAVAQDTPAMALASPCDTVSFCLSKGLGAPMGSMLAGSEDTIHRARRIRKQLGGGMRQAGIVAAAGLYALENQVDDLAHDHRRAATFREEAESWGLNFLLPSPTNILMLHTLQAPKIQDDLARRGINVFAINDDTIRIVFHRDITDNDLDYALPVFKKVLT